MIARALTTALAVLLVLGATSWAAGLARASTPATSSIGGGSTNSSGPSLIPGFHLTFTCENGAIQLNLTQYCLNQTTTQVVCDVSTCQWQIDGYSEFWYEFVSWSFGGVTVTCSTCYQTTLIVHVPNPSQYYAGSITERVQAAWVNVTFNSFVNWTNSSWSVGHIQACMYLVGCANITNGQTIRMLPSYQYSLQATLVSDKYTVEEWQSNAGTIVGARQNPTDFTPSQPGNMSVVILDYFDQAWAGYVYSPETSNVAVTNVTGLFRLPIAIDMAFGTWVGIGGVLCAGKLCQTGLWQAGVNVNYSTGGTVIRLWFLAINGGANGSLFWGNPFTVNPGDLLAMTVTAEKGVCTYSIQDLSKITAPTWSGRYFSNFFPSNHSGEWVLEPKGQAPSGLNMSVGSIAVDGVFNPYAGYLDTEDTFLHYQFMATQLSSGTPNFYIFD